MIKRNLAAVSVAALGLVALSGPLALAHTDSHGESGSQRCDAPTNRGGHHDGEAGDTNGYQPGTTYEQASAVDGTEVYNRSGHYIVRGDSYYVEVVGGGGYGDSGQGNQGGYAQGEIDPAAAPADADFHANAFAPASPDGVNKLPGSAHGGGCVSVANNKVGDPGSVPGSGN